ncbi:MAG: ATP-binding protein [Subdoligranulum sp.]|nr:ATP-binding protein [Subdoligranulum sp.]MCI7542394.1 ATP-binding protein [Subdoligranulum sp.]MDD7264831.1 ATP-binding protein [Subdoligranulum sp.]
MDLHYMDQRLRSLVIFRELLMDPVIAGFEAVLAMADEDDGDAFATVCAEFESSLFESTESWTDYLCNAVLQSENVCVRRKAHGELSPVLADSLQRELALLNELAGLTLEEILAGMENAPDFFAAWTTHPCDLPGEYARRMNEVSVKGYGMFARYHVFVVEDGQLVPVKHPDPQRLSELPGYEKEREKVIANTEALLEGRPANNVLLYGDAGTGKSSAIKAIANEYAPRGLRLVEVKKNQLFQIPDLMDQLASNPLKFILFIDDLSFTTNDDNFAALKAILEGSVGGRAGNIAVYATSNRRHLIKETLEDRSGSDIHESDTRQELMSLAARFGLTVTFGQPDKSRFVQIVSDLAAQYGVGEDPEKLIVKAEAFAIRAGGRSPRVAKQFIELCKAGVLQ